MTLLTASQRSLITQVDTIVTQRLAAQQAGHGIDHIHRVYRAACDIADETPCDRFVVELAALLHDIGDAKFHDGVERSGEFSAEILSELNVDTAVISQVTQIVDSISFRKAVDRASLSMEAKVVQDADRLDALGAVGIVRTIEYGAAFGQPFSVPGQDLDSPDTAPQKTGVGHFHDKLFKLSGLMNTAAARRIALQREQFMREFLAQFARECDTRPGLCGQ